MSVHPADLSSLSFPRKFLQFLKYKYFDIRNYDPDQFEEYGLTLYVGKQGTGKTTAMTEYLERMRDTYPNAIICTNYGYVNQDVEFDDLSKFLTLRNGEEGVIFAIDEIQNEFSSDSWRSLPEGFLQEITQQRKQRIKVVGTTQVFTRVVKALREQAMTVAVCNTYFGRWTRVKIYDAQDYEDALESVMRRRELITLEKRNFVQTDELRSLYDSYARIERMERTGFETVKEGG